MNLKDSLLGGAVVIALMALVFVYVQIQQSKVSKTDTPQTYGSASSPSVVGGCMDIDGITLCYKRQALLTATSTPCSIKSPAATSTLVRAAMKVASTSASATYIEFGKSTTPYATTTSLGIATLGANAQGTAVASSSTAWAGVDGPIVFSPNTYLVVKTAGNTQIGGVCQGTFEAI